MGQTARVRSMRALLVVAMVAGCGGDDGQAVDAGHVDAAVPDAVVPDARPDAGPDDVEWPNAESKANSDPWIAENHARITVMRPKVLALNFVNARSMEEMRTQLEAMIDVIAEGSRYHGYANAGAPAFLQYEIGYAIDLRDASPPQDYPYRNSTKYPREQPVDGYWGLDYEQLFTQQFADYMGIADPTNPSHNLRLDELVDRGMVHEVWIYGDGDVPDVSGAEVLEIKPTYDADRVRVAGPLDRCAGNGCFDDEDTIPLQRSLRIAWFNNTRGPGCFLESLSHGFESMGNQFRNILPSLWPLFDEFGNFQLDEEYGMPFDSWYACPYDRPDCLEYPSETSVTYNITGHTISDYDPVCGNVHFAPNARGQYDLSSPSTVLTSCTHFGDGTGEKEAFTTAAFAPYESLAPDCMGSFLVWWRQNMPGRDAPLLNWWPYLFY
jgi:hypothetical protein